MDPLKLITFNQFVILKLPSDNLKIVELRPNGSISLGKFGAFNVNDIIGYPLGTTFEILYDEDGVDTKVEEKKIVDKRHLNKIPVGKVKVQDQNRKIIRENEKNVEDNEDNNNNMNELIGMNSSENNQNLINLGNDVQKLSMKEIEELKKNKKNSKDIIEKIIKSHDKFHEKTIYSQAKYLKRKRQKFAKFFTVNYLSSSLLLEYLLDKGDIQKVMDMSEESLGMLLNLGNIKSNGKYLVIDETGGLIVYAMMERMFGGKNNIDINGEIIVLHENEHVNLDLLKYSNYDEKFIRKHIKSISLLDFFEPPNKKEIDETFTLLSKEEVRELKGSKKNLYQRRVKWYYSQMEMIRITNKEFKYDGLIVGTTLELKSLIPIIGDRVHGSRNIVCYSQFKETILELSHELMNDLRYLAPSIYEVRCRPYQSERGKLHPLMTMRGGGGYLMNCHKVIPAPEPEPWVAPSTEEQNIEVVKKQKTST